VVCGGGGALYPKGFRNPNPYPGGEAEGCSVGVVCKYVFSSPVGVCWCVDGLRACARVMGRGGGVLETRNPNPYPRGEPAGWIVGVVCKYVFSSPVLGIWCEDML
jgi:hypothetical protein